MDNLGHELPPGATYNEIDAAMDCADDDACQGCVSCFTQNENSPARPGSDLCESCLEVEAEIDSDYADAIAAAKGDDFLINEACDRDYEAKRAVGLPTVRK